MSTLAQLSHEHHGRRVYLHWFAQVRAVSTAESDVSCMR